MFPITDPSRAEDIRMRRRRAICLLAGIVAVPVLLFSGHQKPTATVRHGGTDLDVDLHALSIRSGTLPGTEISSILHRIPLVGHMDWMVEGAPLPAGRRDAAALSANGAALTVALPCARSITLVPQQDLADRIFVSAQDGEAAGAGLRLTGGPQLALAGACRQGVSDLVIQAPASMPLTLVQSGDTALRLGAFTGPVRLTQHGSGDAVIDAAGPLEVDKSGTGDLSVGLLRGPLHLSQAGSGDTAINRSEAVAVDASLTGSGDLSIAAGHVGRLSVTVHGSGDLAVDAEVGDAAIRASGSSDIALPHVTGRLDRRTLDE